MDEIAPITSASEFVAKAVPVMIGASFICRGVAEGLLLIAERFKSDEAGKAAVAIGKFADGLGRVVAVFGFGMPKAMVMAKAEKMALKELNGESVRRE